MPSTARERAEADEADSDRRRVGDIGLGALEGERGDVNVVRGEPHWHAGLSRKENEHGNRATGERHRDDERQKIAEAAPQRQRRQELDIAAAKAKADGEDGEAGGKHGESRREMPKRVVKA